MSAVTIPELKFHTMQAVENLKADKGERHIWTQKTCHGQGLYIFGGQNSKGEVNNDLWYIEPLYTYNQRLLSGGKYEYVTDKPALALTIEKVTDYTGRPPIART